MIVKEWFCIFVYQTIYCECLYLHTGKAIIKSEDHIMNMSLYYIKQLFILYIKRQLKTCATCHQVFHNCNHWFVMREFNKVFFFFVVVVLKYIEKCDIFFNFCKHNMEVIFIVEPFQHDPSFWKGFYPQTKLKLVQKFFMLCCFFKKC